MASERDLAIVKRVMKEMTGTTWNDDDTITSLLESVELAGDGDYVEIGVLHGGSLCAVALKKRELGHKGICYGIDPLNGYKGGLSVSGVVVGLDTVEHNIQHFGLDNVVVIQAKSQPFMLDGPFKVAFIDGDHTGKAPWEDWLALKDITTGYIHIHDYKKYQMVTATCDLIERDHEWQVVKRNRMNFIVKRVA
jgi:hypothetical protein